jgi:hypothetical protein
MKPTAVRFLFLSAIFVAFFGISRAQLVTSSTLPNWTGSVITFNPNQTLGQTFTGVIALEQMTYSFFSASANSTAGDLAVTFGEWNGSALTSTLYSSTIGVTSSSTWSNPLLFGARNTGITVDLSFTYENQLDPAKTYALLLTNQSGSSTDFGLGLVTSDAFAYGSAYPFGSAMDWAFTQISVVPEGNEIPPPVPEASTVAAMIGAAFIAGLVGLRLRQRRQLAALPVAPVAA